MDKHRPRSVTVGYARASRPDGSDPFSGKRLFDANGDWLPTVVTAAIWVNGSSLHRLSRQHGYATDALKVALRRPWPKAEKIIADFLGRTPQQIWPSRYDANGNPNRRRGRPAMDGNTGAKRSVIRARRAA